MSERGAELLADDEAHKFTVEELEALVEILEQVDPLTPTEKTALAKLRWHISAAEDEGDA